MSSRFPNSSPLAYVTPSSAEVLLRCPLRLSYARQARTVGAGSPATWIGEAAHLALERLIRERGLWSASPGAQATQLFDEELARFVGRVEPDALERWGVDPVRWPRFALKRARLAKVADRLARLLGNIQPDQTLPEVDYSTFAGRLRGRADLVVNAPTLHAVADYKTGRAVDDEHEPLPAYERQVRLYCAMEEERSGSFPTFGWLVPFDGPMVEVHVNAGTCRELAEEALDALSRFNERAPGPQPAIVSTDNCPTCPFAPVCPDLWHALRDGIPEGVEAVRGVVQEVRHAEIGGISLVIEPSTSTMETGRSILVRNVSKTEHPMIEGVREGKPVSLVGLIEEGDRGTYRLGRGGHVHSVGDQAG